MQGLTVIPASFLGVKYICQKDQYPSGFCRGESNDRATSIFLVFLGISLRSLMLREVGWLVQMILWRNRSTENYKSVTPRYATIKYYSTAAVGHIFLAFVCVGVLFYMSSINDSTNEFHRQFRELRFPVILAVLVGVLTGDVISGGLIVGLEQWSITFKEITHRLAYLVPTALVVSLFVLHHSISTFLAISGFYPFYLKYLKAVRWRWDSLSEMSVKELNSSKVLCSTSYQRPFFTNARQ